MTSTVRLGAVLFASVSLATIPSVASAQDTATNDLAAEQPAERENDDDFPWGLLGLLGLAGLMGLKKRDDRDVHVDARRDTRP